MSRWALVLAILVVEWFYAADVLGHLFPDVPYRARLKFAFGMSAVAGGLVFAWEVGRVA